MKPQHEDIRCKREALCALAFGSSPVDGSVRALPVGSATSKEERVAVDDSDMTFAVNQDI